MTDTLKTTDPAGPVPSKFDAHYRQQLSALVDGELSADEARFMLRRIEHDAELSGCHERWQMLGDVLRGNACAPAPVDFSERVRLALAADIGQNGPVTAPAPRISRTGWKRWSGGAALAASVAMVAMFMGRQQLPTDNVPDTVIAATAEVPAAPSPSVAAAASEVVVPAAAPAVAAAVARRQDAPRRGSATRSQQAARSLAARQQEPQRAVASSRPSPPAVLAPALRPNPFAQVANPLPARPWPRSSITPALSQGVFNANVPVQEPQAAFYPFEPRLPGHESEFGQARTLLPRD